MTGPSQVEKSATPDDEPTAQDVIDALRFCLMAQKDSGEALRLVDCLLDWAPETDSDRGVQLILRMIAEASLKVSLVDA